MSFPGCLGAVCALIVIAVVAAGCGGGTVLDATKTEEQLQASLSNSLHAKVSSVDCPSGEKVEAGRTFSCSVKFSDGKTGKATLEIRNEDADTSVIDFTETSQHGQ